MQHKADKITDPNIEMAEILAYKLVWMHNSFAMAPSISLSQ